MLLPLHQGWSLRSGIRRMEHVHGCHTEGWQSSPRSQWMGFPERFQMKPLGQCREFLSRLAVICQCLPATYQCQMVVMEEWGLIFPINTTNSRCKHSSSFPNSDSSCTMCGPMPHDHCQASVMHPDWRPCGREVWGDCWRQTHQDGAAALQHVDRISLKVHAGGRVGGNLGKQVSVLIELSSCTVWLNSPHLFLFYKGPGNSSNSSIFVAGQIPFKLLELLLLMLKSHSPKCCFSSYWGSKICIKLHYWILFCKGWQNWDFILSAVRTQSLANQRKTTKKKKKKNIERTTSHC